MENKVSRLDDMLKRYGEVCTQGQAGRILNVVPRTIRRMMAEGRLRRIGHRVDVRSIAEYLENPRRANFTARSANAKKSMLSESDFFAAAKSGRWAPKK